MRPPIVERYHVKKSGEKGKDKMLKREEVRQKLIEWGNPEPTEEQVSDYLATISKETKSAEDRAARFKADSDKVRDLEKQLEELNSQNLTDLELSQKKTEEALKEVESLRSTVKQMELQKSLAEIGITGDDATGLFGEDGSLNTELLGKIIEGREKSAVAAFQKQALDDTPAPDEQKGDDKDDPKPYQDIVDRVVASKKAETDAASIVDSYK